MNQDVKAKQKEISDLIEKMRRSNPYESAVMAIKVRDLTFEISKLKRSSDNRHISSIAAQI